MGRSKSSHRWMQEHFKDHYVQKAQEQGLRSRAVFKLQEIQEKDRVLKPGQTVIDLGAAPGGWSEYARSCVGRKGSVFALDILPMDPVAEVDFVLGDFREESVMQELLNRLDNRPVDIVISDMAPNMSGNRAVDQPRAMYLAELALDLATQVLCRDGAFLSKVFQGEGSEEFLRTVRQHFKRVVIRKPKSSRPRSREVYVLAQGYRV